MNHARQKHFKFVRICTDSLSSLQAFENYNIHNHQASIIRTYLCQMKKENIKIELEWVRGHDGIRWNERADEVAKSAMRKDFPNYNYERIA